MHRARPAPGRAARGAARHGGQPLLVRADHGHRRGGTRRARRHARSGRGPGRPRVRRTGAGLPRDRDRSRAGAALRRLRRPGQALHQGSLRPVTAARPPSWRSWVRASPDWAAIPACRCTGCPMVRRSSATSPASCPRSARGRWPGWSRSCPSFWPWRPPIPTRTAASGPGTGRPRRRPGGRTPTAARCGWWTDDPRTARLELRIPGADTSPHHCLAMFLGAAMWGIEERLDPPPPVIPPADGHAAAACALPHDLTRRPTASPPARRPGSSSVPPSSSHFAPSRRAEVAACHRFVSARGAGPLHRPGLTMRDRER